MIAIGNLRFLEHDSIVGRCSPQSNKPKFPSSHITADLFRFLQKNFLRGVYVYRGECLHDWPGLIVRLVRATGGEG